MMGHWLRPIILTLTLLIASACADTAAPQPVGGAEEERIKAALAGRSFRQFDPSVDASPRKGVTLDFIGTVRIWAQYSEGRQAVQEWELVAEDYRIEKHGDNSEITIYLDQPRSRQELPTRCDNCIPTAGVSISIRNVLDSEKVSFRLNDPDGVLPPPFPVFGSWTRFAEDEIVH